MKQQPVARISSVRIDVVVRGSGFDAPGLVALVDGTPVPVAEASDGELVLVGTDDVAGLVEIRTDLGAGTAPAATGPRPTIEILPDRATVAEGSSAQFHAVERGVADTTVEWSVDEAATVAISPDGVLEVGHGAPAPHDTVAVARRQPDRADERG